jgi:hypothetical protein
METLTKFYLNDPYFLLLAKNAQPYPVTPETVPMATSRPQNIGWQLLAGLVLIGLVVFATKKYLIPMLEKDSDEY